MRSFEIKNNLEIIVVFSIIVTFGILTALFVPLYKPQSHIILGFAGILLGIASIILGFVIYRQQKKLKEIDKCKKILEIKQRRCEILPKSLKYAMIFLYCLLTFGIVVNVIRGNNIGFSLIVVLICSLIIFFGKIKYEIYEKGVVCGMQFIKWDRIKKVTWENRILEIKAEKVIESIMIKDKNGKIKNIVEKIRSIPQ